MGVIWLNILLEMISKLNRGITDRDSRKEVGKMTTVICLKCGTENLPDAIKCKKCQFTLKWAVENISETESLKKTEKPVVKNEITLFLYLVTGGIAGLVGGFVRAFFFDEINFGIDLYCACLPLLVPLLGVVAATFIWALFDKKLNKLAILLTAGIGFLAGFIPIDYYIPF